jgi:CDP-diacylglycerol--glycerol-3-phosphate 3-phosphatidyltransferase
MDRVSDLAIFAGLGALMTSRGSVGGTLLVFWALTGAVMTSYVRARAESELNELSAGYMERAERCVVLILGALVGWIELALLVVALGSTVTTVQRMRLARRMIRTLEETGRDPSLTRQEGGP